jgi:hypothetical protein
MDPSKVAQASQLYTVRESICMPIEWSFMRRMQMGCDPHMTTANSHDQVQAGSPLSVIIHLRHALQCLRRIIENDRVNRELCTVCMQQPTSRRTPLSFGPHTLTFIKVTNPGESIYTIDQIVYSKR